MLLTGCNSSSSSNSIPEDDYTTSWLLKADALLEAEIQQEAYRYPDNIEVRENDSNGLIEYRVRYVPFPSKDLHFRLVLETSGDALRMLVSCIRSHGYTTNTFSSALDSDFNRHYGYAMVNEEGDTDFGCSMNLIEDELLEELVVVKSWTDFKNDFDDVNNLEFDFSAIMKDDVIEAEMRKVDHYYNLTLYDARNLLDMEESYEIQTEVRLVLSDDFPEDQNRYTHGLLWGSSNGITHPMVVSGNQYLYISDDIYLASHFKANEGEEFNHLRVRVSPNYVAFFLNDYPVSAVPKNRFESIGHQLGYWVAHSHRVHYTNSEIRGTALAGTQ